MKSVKKILFLCIIVLNNYSVFAQQAGSFEFVNQNITDILFVFSAYSDVPIIADDTVMGTTTFQFAGSNFEKAFDSFLLLNRLYVDKKEDVWLVSKMRIIESSENVYSINAFDVSLSQIIEKLSSVSNTTIIHDLLPATKQSIHIENMSVEDALTVLFKPYSEYSVQTEDNYMYIKRNQVIAQPQQMFTGGSVDITGTNGFYSVFVENASLKEVLDRFFIETNKEYTSFAQSDVQIERINFTNKSFEDSLRMILEMANAQAQCIDNIWYIFQVSSETVQQQALEKNKTWQRFELHHSSLADIQSLLHTRFPHMIVHELSDKKSFITQLDDTESAELKDYLTLIDIPSSPEVITLKYIKAEDLLNNLPPSVKREDISLTGTTNTIFFMGGEKKKEQFLIDLQSIDVPQQRIRYDLLIVEYQKTSSLQWGVSSEMSPLVPGDKNIITGTLGNLLNLNFDVVTVFGHLFASKINTALGENEARIFTDTTLYGVSGQTIEFENTNTYRYRDSNIDPETGKPIYTGVTRELVSGLVLDINGWVSGDGMITTTVSASVSKQGIDLSSQTGNPPPSTEKKITTQVRSRSGEVVILSGLTQNNTTFMEEGIPLIQDVPVLNWFSGSKNHTNEMTEMVIYLLPHLDVDETKINEEERMMNAYTIYVKDSISIGYKEEVAQ